MTPTLPTTGGSYVLVFYTPTPCSIRVGALGQQHFKSGFYCYVGSAHGAGGLRARVARHLSTCKTLRWHMDYLRNALLAQAVWWHAGSDRLEDTWVEHMAHIGLRPYCKGFGASDSRHATHLFYSEQPPDFERFQAICPEAACSHCKQI